MAMRREMVVLLVVLVLFVLGCKEEEKNIVARVNDRVLTVEDLQEMIPPEYFFQMSREQKETFVKRWIETELLYQEALRRGIREEAKIRLMLEEAEKQIVVNEMLAREMTHASDQEVEEYFNRHKDEYDVTVKIAHILLATEEDAREVLTMLKAGERFDKLAKERSLDTSSAGQGGVLGYKRKGDLKDWPALEEAVFSLKNKGDVSGVVRSDYGYHIVKLLERSPLREKVTVEDVREEIRMLLSREKQEEKVTTLLAQLRGEAKTEENFETLK